MQTADGLAAAHAQGLVHRDIKPANILLENGVERVKITDFGLARAVDDASLTHTGFVAGTPQYMSPEQARGETVDHRADLFSLGSVLYAMCTGQPPFRAGHDPGGAAARLRRHAPADPRGQPRRARLARRDHREAARQGPGRAIPVGGRGGRLARRHLAHLQQPRVVPMPPRLGYRSPAGRATRRRWLVRITTAAAVTLSIGFAVTAAILWHSRSPDQSANGEESIQKVAIPGSGGDAAAVDLAAVGSKADAWDPLMPEIEQMGARLSDLEVQMRSARDARPSVVGQRFSEVQTRLQRLERDLSANGSE